MKTLVVRNVHLALPIGLDFLSQEGIERDSRNGAVIQAKTPVTTTYNRPTERVLFWADRDANPFFHLMESLWMLAGRNDVEFCTRFVKRMLNFSDDGKTFHGAYGYRWRVHFGFDQLKPIIEALKANHNDRRQVIQMWDATVDLGKQGKDFPCNTLVFVAINTDGELDITVCNRSNDMIWGAYGANAVHFSVLQEYLASAIGVPVGKYYQVSNNFHAYKDTFDPLKHLADRAPDCYRQTVDCPYSNGLVAPYPLISTDVETWEQDLKMFMSEGAVLGLKDPFFRKVAVPVYLAHVAYAQNKNENGINEALEILEQCKATDWKLACVEWLERRRANFLKKQIEKAKAADDGVSYE